MPDAAQYTLALFDTTALGWTVDIPRPRNLVPGPGPADRRRDRPAPTSSQPSARSRSTNYVLAGERPLARGWAARARDNIRAITLSKEIENSGRAPTRDEQGELLRFIGFGATELGAELLSASRRRRVPGRLAGDRREPGGGHDGRRIRRPSARHPIRALHARADHPRHLARRAASRLHRRARAGARHGHGPVLRR